MRKTRIGDALMPPPPDNDDFARVSAAPRVRCHASADADSSDVELAARINEYLAGGEAGADHLETLAPAFREAVYWVVGAAAVAVAAVWLLT